MLCDNCGKKEATVHIREIINGNSRMINLCPDCAAAKQICDGLGGMGLDLAGLLGSIGGFAAEVKKKSGQADPDTVCPECGWDFKKIREHGGSLGCPECYRAFTRLVRQAADRIHCGSMHTGKRPSGEDGQAAAIRMELREKRRELKNFVRREAYEKAAECRDRIRLLTSALASAVRRDRTDE